MKSTIYKNLWTIEEITYLQSHFDAQPYTHIQEINGVLWCKNKNLDYHIPNTPVYEIVKPKIQNILGNHEIANGSYKESYFPYAHHIDGYHRPDFKESFQAKNTMEHDTAFLIPLVENTHFNTISFNCFDPYYETMGGKLKDEWLNSYNNLNLDDFDHISSEFRQDISKLPVDKIFNWKVGNAFSWKRDQLHASTNFAKYRLVKKFIIIFIA
jgi:hypothetical protein